MTRMPELEQALVAAGRRRYGRPAWRRAVTPVVAAIALAAVAVIALSIGTPERELPAETLVPLELPTGKPLTAAQADRLRAEGLTVPPGAIAIAAPAIFTLPKDTTLPDSWFVLPEDDRVCVRMTYATGCVSREEFAQRGVFTYDTQPARRVGGGILAGALVIQALLPPDVTAVELAEGDVVGVSPMNAGHRTYSGRTSPDAAYRLTLKKRHGVEVVIHDDPRFGEPPGFAGPGGYAPFDDP